MGVARNGSGRQRKSRPEATLAARCDCDQAKRGALFLCRKEAHTEEAKIIIAHVEGSETAENGETDPCTDRGRAGLERH
jgi:hypothetical protein